MRFCVPVTGGVAGSAPPAGAGDVGGKARSLLRLAGSGWPVPRAFAVTTELFRQLRRSGPPLPMQLRTGADVTALERARAALVDTPFPAGFEDELRDSAARVAPSSARRIPPPYSVRSSFASEDRLGALAAGLFHSAIRVPVPALAAAVRAVLASALSPAVFRYTVDRRLDLDGAGMAVLLHPFLSGDASGSAAWDPAASAPPLLEVTHPTVAAPLPAAIRDKLERALRELGRQHGPVEVEWVWTAPDEITFLQMRAYQRRPEPARWPGTAALGPGAWQWDAAHNPLPLSPAQAELIRLVDERCRLGFRQKVVGGYLFYGPHTTLPGAPPPAAIEGTPVRKQLASVEVELARSISALGGTPTLDAALDLFASVYQRLFAEVQPATRRARAALEGLLETYLPGSLDAVAVLLSDVPSVATDRQRAAARIRESASAAVRLIAIRDYVTRFGDEAPVWDVAMPTYREDPRFLERLPPGQGAPWTGATPQPDGEMSWQRASRAIDARLPERARAIWPRLLREARDAVAVAEEDDHLYARLQAVVRRALLSEGERLRAEGVIPAAEDVFFLPLERVRVHARRTSILSSDDTMTLLRRARAADEAARRSPPPLPMGSTRWVGVVSGAATMIHGLPGAAGRVVGRAFLYPAPSGAQDAAPDATSIVVATTLLPAELPLVDAAGIVVETGGVLGHVAAQARERGIPAVVSAVGARGAIKSGDQLLVDGDGGYVLRL